MRHHVRSQYWNVFETHLLTDFFDVLSQVGKILSVSDLGKVADLLKKNRVEARTVGKRLIVDPADGQGAIIAFVEG